MTKHPLRAKSRGQSIPLIALLIVVLIGAVGLAVDVGNNYAQQRNVVRATNAAALSGMNALIQGGTDQSVGQVIQQSLKSNKVDGVYNNAGGSASAPDQRLIEAYYLDSKGNPLASCVIGSCGHVPSGVTYIQVRVRGDVSTYFARVLQRPTLPVKAQAFAGRCSPLQGVYPIGVQSSNLDTSGFIKPNPEDTKQPSNWTIYKDADYPGGLTQRRIYMKDEANSPGNFSFLRWRADKSSGSTPDLIEMLDEDGNLDQGFDEGVVKNGVTTWPDPNSQPPMVNGKVVYPIKPHEVNSGDFVHANTGVQISSGVETALKKHIDRKDVLILPIVKPAVGTGNNAAFQIVGFGSFYLVGIPGYGTGTDVKGGGANSFFDLVYINTANSISCLSTPAVTSNTLGITGAVYLKPRWGQAQPGQPIAYQIIMDVSGSMSWNFDGQGNLNGSGSVRQCEAYGNVAAQDCPNGGGDYWKTQNERRVYVLKQAMAGTGGFIDSMRASDTMRIITFSTASNGSMKIDTGAGWSKDPVALKQAVMDAGKVGTNPYLTSGGTPGPKALQQANTVLQNSLPTDQDYKPVVIYMTDGVANIFLDGATNKATDICPQYGGDSRALSTPSCQYDPPPDYIPNASHGMRPITAMIDQANKMKDRYSDLQLFVVALGQVNVLGLDQVASDPDLVFPARSADLVAKVLTQIKAKAEGPCTEVSYPGFISHIDAAHTAVLPSGPTLPTGVYGYVYLTDNNGAAVNVPWVGPGTDPRVQKNAIPVMQDGIGENLTYTIPSANGLPPGVYRLSGAVYYKAAKPEGDGLSRQYDQIKPGLSDQQYMTFELLPATSLGSAVVLDPVRLELSDAIKVCPDL